MWRLRLRKMLVQECLIEIKKHYLKCIDKSEKPYDVLRHTIAYVKIKKWRLTVHYVKPTAQLLFKSRFQKVDQHAGGKWLIHDNKRHKDYQLQSLKLPCPSWVSWCDIKGPDDDSVHWRIHASSCFSELMQWQSPKHAYVSGTLCCQKSYNLLIREK